MCTEAPYVVHYGTYGTESNTVATYSTNAHITGLTSGATYTIVVEVTTRHLSAESEEWIITLGRFKIVVYNYADVNFIVHLQNFVHVALDYPTDAPEPGNVKGVEVMLSRPDLLILYSPCLSRMVCHYTKLIIILVQSNH